MITLTNQRAVPVIVIDDQTIIGFDQQKIDDALSKQ
jgi:glutaredoxin